MTAPTNPAGLAFYDRLVDELLGAGIRPVVTLYHWDLPQALEDRGGWRSRDVAGWFTDYAATVVGALGDRVRNWTTLNEPWCSSMLSHAIGAHAPGHRDPMEGLLTAHHLMLAHGSAVPAIREHCPDAEVSITLNPTQVHGPRDADEADVDAVRRADNALNGVFFGPLFHGAYPEGFLDDVAHLTDGPSSTTATSRRSRHRSTTSASTTTSPPASGPPVTATSRSAAPTSSPAASASTRSRRARRSPRWAGSSPPSRTA